MIKKKREKADQAVEVKKKKKNSNINNKMLLIQMKMRRRRRIMIKIMDTDTNMGMNHRGKKKQQQTTTIITFFFFFFFVVVVVVVFVFDGDGHHVVELSCVELSWTAQRHCNPVGYNTSTMNASSANTTLSGFDIKSHNKVHTFCGMGKWTSSEVWYCTCGTAHDAEQQTST